MPRRTACLSLAIVALLVAPAAAPAASPSLSAPVKTLHAGHITIAYRSVGHGPPLVLLMGFAGTIDAWDPALVDGLARHHRVIAVENRGIGRSTGPIAHLSIETMADDANRAIRALHLRRPAVLGWSMGGFIAQDLAIHHPRSVERLVLAATSPPAPFATLPSAVTFAQLPLLLFPPDRPGALSAYIGRTLKYPDFHTVPAATLQAQAGAVAQWLTRRTKSEDPRHVVQRTLVADGDSDRLTPPANSRTLARRIPHAKLHLYRDAAHGFLSQYHAAFARAVDAFLR